MLDDERVDSIRHGDRCHMPGIVQFQEFRIRQDRCQHIADGACRRPGAASADQSHGHLHGFQVSALHR